MTNAICDQCGTEGLADVFEKEGVKRVARQCPECGHYWEYNVT